MLDMKIYQNRKVLSKIKEWDFPCFLQTIAKFTILKFNKEFKAYEVVLKHDKLKLHIEFLSNQQFKKLSSSHCRGNYCAVENGGYISINVDKTIEMSKCGFNYKTLFDALIFTALHEIGHFLKNVSDFLENNKKNLEEQFDITNEVIGEKISKLKQDSPKIEEWEIASEITEEQEADLFAFENLHVFKNMYLFHEN